MDENLDDQGENIDVHLTKQPYVSIIIPSFNRGSFLLKTLESFLFQDYSPYEIIIIDSSDEFNPSLQQLLMNQQIIRYSWTEKKGPSQAKNEGISQSRGDIIIFCDDDVIAKKNFISMHARNYKNVEIGGVGGRVITKKDKPPESIKRVGKIRFDMSIIGNFNAITKTEIDHVYGCNMSFRKEILVKIGGFDVSFSGNAYFEETDLSIRVRKLGYKIIFEPDAMLIHVQPEVGGCRVKDFKRWMYWYYHNYAILLKKHYKISLLPFFFIRQIVWICVWTLAKKDLTLPIIASRAFKKGWEGYHPGYV